MKFKFGHRERAISTVLTTIIILVGSVVLGTGVVLYGASLFQTSTQQEAITVSGLKLWVHGTDPQGNGLAWGAFSVRNSGDKVLSIDKINIRGQDVPFTQWYPDTTVTSTILQQAMNFTSWSNVKGLISNNTNGLPAGCAHDLEVNIIAGSSIDNWVCANKATGPVGLDPGKGAIIYFKLNNNTLTSLDSGVSTSAGVFAGKAGAPISVTVASKT